MKKVFIIITLFGLLYAATPVLAQQADYQLLAPIPLKGAGSPETKQTNASGDYLKGIFMLAIAIAGGLAVVMIIFGGIEYMTSETLPGKKDGRERITNAIWGLMLAIGAWLILNTINPKLTDFNFTVSAPAGATTGTSGTIGSSGTLSGGGLGNELAGNGGAPLSNQAAKKILEDADIIVKADVNNIRQGIVDELVKLKKDCGCDVQIASATGGSHSLKYECNHRDGYKADLRSNGNGAKLTDYIKKNYGQVVDVNGKPILREGHSLYTSPSGGVYMFEDDHWDVAKC